MPKMWITYLPHFLNETGAIQNDLPAPTHRLVQGLCTFVTYATHFHGSDDEELPLCFNNVNRKRCRGRVIPVLSNENNEIFWQCHECRISGVISGWEGTLWDLSEKCELH